MSLGYARLKCKPTRTRPRPADHRFGVGILPYTPHAGRMPFTAEEEAEMFGQPRQRSLKEVMESSQRGLDACKVLLKSIDRHEMRLRGIMPVSGGAPARFVPSDQDWDDFHQSSREFNEYLGDDMQYVGAVG